MRKALRSIGSGAVLAALAMVSCSDGVTDEDARSMTASLNVAAAVSGSAGGGPAQAYSSLDRLFVRVLAGGQVRLEQELAFDPSGPETTVPLSVPLRSVTETVTIELELRATSLPVFRGTAAALLTVATGSNVDVTLTPVVAGVACGGELLELTAYGDSLRVPGFALFATGDSIPEVPVEWSTAQGTIVEVTAQNFIKALQDGEAVVTCRVDTFTDTRSVRVFADVAAVQVSPAEASTLVGSSVAFSSTLRDSRNNLIVAPRPVSWSSSSTAIAEVSAAGVALGIGPGTVAIAATSGTSADTAWLTVAFPPPVVTTLVATGVTGSAAMINGLVDPRGAPTQAWFEWGTSAALTAFTQTPVQQVAAGAAPVPVEAALANLLPNTTYYFRTVASSDGGVTRGEILSFTTPRPPTVASVGAALQAQAVDQRICVECPPFVLTALLEGTVNPNGSQTLAGFEWGTSSTLALATRGTMQDVGSGTAVLSFIQETGVLEPGTTYYARILAGNDGGSTLGNIISFTTPAGEPEVATGSSGWSLATVGNTLLWTATMSGIIMPNGGATTAWIEFTTDATFTTYSSSPSVSLAAGNSQVTIEHSFSVEGGPDGGAPTYYFRAAASNLLGTARSAPQIVGATVLR
jgi:hypothetical protein